MEGGRVYVVYNDWIQNPEAEDGAMTYKIGITENTAHDRYKGLGLKMPGEFDCEFEYEFDDERYKKVEKTLHDLLSMSNVGGEWFDLDDKALDGVRSACEMFGGRLVPKPDEEESGDGEQAEINPALGKVVDRWNEVSDMKAVGTGSQKKRIHIPDIGSNGREVVYYFSVMGGRRIIIGLRCNGIGKGYPAVAGLFQEDVQLNGRVFECVKENKQRTWKLRTIVPAATDVDEVVGIMKSLIEATKDKIVGGWGKE